MPLAPHEITITDSDIQTYHEQGYWISPVLFDETEIETIRREVVRICKGERDFDTMHWLGTPKLEDDSPNVNQVCNGWWVNKVMREMVKAPVIGHIGATFMAADTVRIWMIRCCISPASVQMATPRSPTTSAGIRTMPTGNAPIRTTSVLPGSHCRIRICATGPCSLSKARINGVCMRTPIRSGPRI